MNEIVEEIRAIKEMTSSLLVVARADAIFSKALINEFEFQQMARAIDVPLHANMTEFGKTPYFTKGWIQTWHGRFFLTWEKSRDKGCNMLTI